MTKNAVQIVEGKEVADYIEPVSAVERMIERGVDPTILEKFMDLQERVADRDAKRLFNAAMVKAQAKMPIVPKDADNQQTHSKYSKYETILKHCKPIYTAEGFSVSFYEEDSPKENHVRICADVMHEGGWTEKRHTDIPIDNVGAKGTTNKTLVHGKGSSFSYGRSYLMKLIFNIPTGDDDDGNAAGEPPEEAIDEKTAVHILELAESAPGGKKRFDPWLESAYGVKSAHDLTAKQGEAVKNSMEAAIKSAKK